MVVFFISIFKIQPIFNYQNSILMTFIIYHWWFLKVFSEVNGLYKNYFAVLVLSRSFARETFFIFSDFRFIYLFIRTNCFFIFFIFPCARKLRMIFLWYYFSIFPVGIWIFFVFFLNNWEIFIFFLNNCVYYEIFFSPFNTVIIHFLCFHLTFCNDLD